MIKGECLLCIDHCSLIIDDRLLTVADYSMIIVYRLMILSLVVYCFLISADCLCFMYCLVLSVW